MTKPCTLDQLFILAEATPFLEKLPAAQPVISKLLDDAGIQLDIEMGTPESKAPPGPQKARLLEHYRPINYDRLERVMVMAYLGLNQSQIDSQQKETMKKELSGIMKKLDVVPVSAPTPKARAQKPGR